MRELLESSGETNQVIRALELGSYARQTFWEGRRAGDFQSPTANDWINHVCVVKLPENPKRMRLREFPGWWTWGDSGRVACSESIEAPCPFPIPCPTRLFHLVISESHPFLINQWYSKENVSLSPVSHTSKLIKPEEGSGDCLLYSQWVSSTAYNRDLRLASEVGEGTGL